MTDPVIRETAPLRKTRAYVDLDALRRNMSRIGAHVGGAAIAPAVKADAYGHGLIPVASALVESGASMLAVANLEEYDLIRRHGIVVPVLILEDLFDDEVEYAVRSGASLSVGSLEYARLIDRAARRLGTTASCHVNVDTGMGRMGVIGEDVVATIAAAAAMDGVWIEGIFSHFPSSDEADKAPSFRQLEAYRQILREAEDRGVRPRYRHIANSGAILDFPAESTFDMVRPGVIVYGMPPSTEVSSEIGVEPVLSLVSRVVKINRHRGVDTIGYGRTFQTRPGSNLGIVPIGYGDGYPRSLSNRADVLVHGRRVPLAGRVSMDMIAVDLSSVPEPVRVGDDVVLIGAQTWRHPTGERRDSIDAIELARIAGTISYEITCALSPRIPRVYLEAGRVSAVHTMSRRLVSGGEEVDG